MGRLLLVGNDPDEMLARRLDLAHAAAAHGHEVHLVVPAGPSVARLQTHGFPVHVLPLSRRSLGPLQELSTRRALRRLYRALRPDLVHHFTIKPVVHGGAAARHLGIPAVNSVTGLGSAELMPGPKGHALRSLLRRLYRQALRAPRSLTVFQNMDDLELFVRRRLVDPKQTRLVAGSGVDLERFRPLPEPPGTPVVLFVGRFLKDKGLLELVAAGRQLHKAGVQVRFALAGAPDPGNPSALAPAEVASWVAEGVVEDWGHFEDVRDAMRRTHIVVLPSYREGVPRALLEAAACARPLVATDVPGCRDVCRHGETGLLVPPRDATALAVALQRLASDGPLRARLGQGARRLVEERFGREAIERQMLAVYAELSGPKA